MSGTVRPLLVVLLVVALLATIVSPFALSLVVSPAPAPPVAQNPGSEEKENEAAASAFSSILRFLEADTKQAPFSLTQDPPGQAEAASGGRFYYRQGRFRFDWTDGSGAVVEQTLLDEQGLLFECAVDDEFCSPSSQSSLLYQLMLEGPEDISDYTVTRNGSMHSFLFVVDRTVRIPERDASQYIDSVEFIANEHRVVRIVTRAGSGRDSVTERTYTLGALSYDPISDDATFVLPFPTQSA